MQRHGDARSLPATGLPPASWTAATTCARSPATPAGNETASAIRTNKVIDNDTTPTGADIQTVNGGATAGRAEQNDMITLTYSEPISPTTINASFTGASMAMRVSLTNNGGGDRMDFTTTAGTRLNLVNSATSLNLGGTGLRDEHRGVQRHDGPDRRTRS